MTSQPPPFAAPYAPPDEIFAAAFLRDRPDAATRAAIETKARTLVRGMRAEHSPLGGVEDFLHEFSLSTREGLAVMALAESLLRVPDDATADALIADKLAAGDFSHHKSSSDTLLVQAAPSRSASRRGSWGKASRAGSSPISRGASACRHCASRRGRPCGSWARISSSARRSTTRWPGPPIAASAFPSTCWAKARAAPRTPSAISMPTPTRSARSARRRARRRCRSVRAFPSSSLRCIPAAKRSRASACRGNCRRACWSLRASRKRAISPSR